MKYLNKIYCCDCLDYFKLISKNSVDLVVTSPPYDNLKTYQNTLNWNETIWKNVIKGLYSLVKNGGIVVWIVGDSTINGSETCTSFKQALYFKEVGFNLHDTMIYEKSGFSNPSSNRYHAVFEYMFVFSKGKLKTFNPIKDRKNKYVGIHGGERSYRAEFGLRYNIWRYNNGFNNTSKYKETFKHDAPFPEQLARDHILSWSNKNDLVLDPFLGSGTTFKICQKLNRNFIGCEINKTYCKIAAKRCGLNKISILKGAENVAA